MEQIIYSDNLLTTLSSCNCSVGYFFTRDHFNTINQLLKTLNLEFLLSYNDFDIGFLIWNSLSSSLSVVMQKLSGSDTSTFFPNLLPEIEMLIIDEDCLQYNSLIIENQLSLKIILIKENNETGIK